MVDNDAILFAAILCAVLSVGLFVLLAWKFGRRLDDGETRVAGEEVHLSTQP